MVSDRTTCLAVRDMELVIKYTVYGCTKAMRAGKLNNPLVIPIPNTAPCGQIIKFLSVTLTTSYNNIMYTCANSCKYSQGLI